MKKFILTVLLCLPILPAYCVLPPDAAIIQVHDMQMINQQRFRMEELNDYNDVETEKARFEKGLLRKNRLLRSYFIRKNLWKKTDRLRLKMITAV